MINFNYDGKNNLHEIDYEEIDACPLVSILIPTYNRAETLEHAITSALQQKYQNIEIIISDNHSTDDTKAVVSKFSDKRILYYCNEKNVGPILNWRCAINRAKGKYGIILCDDDYFIDDNYIVDSVNLFKENTSISFIITDCIIGSKEPRSTKLNLGTITNGLEFFNDFWIGKYYIPVMSNMFKINLVNQLPVVCNNEILFSDIELWLLLMLKGDVGFINRPTVYYRVHDNNMVTIMNDDIYEANAKFIDNIASYLKSTEIIDSVEKWRHSMIYRYVIFITESLAFKINYDSFKRIVTAAGSIPCLWNYLIWIKLPNSRKQWKNICRHIRRQFKSKLHQ